VWAGCPHPALGCEITRLIRKNLSSLIRQNHSPAEPSIRKDCKTNTDPKWRFGLNSASVEMGYSGYCENK
jgi:hypothetical protein